MSYLSPVIVPNATNPRTGSGMQQARKPRAEQAVKQERDLRGGTRLGGLAPIDRRRVFLSPQGPRSPSETKAHREDRRTGSGRAVQQPHRDHFGGLGEGPALETPAGFGQHGKPPDGPELGTSCERGLPRRRTERQWPISAARDSSPGASRAVDTPCMQSGIDPRCEGLFGSDQRELVVRRGREPEAESRHPQLERRVGWTPREGQGASLGHHAMDSTQDAPQCLTVTSVEGRNQTRKPQERRPWRLNRAKHGRAT